MSVMEKEFLAALAFALGIGLLFESVLALLIALVAWVVVPLIWERFR